MVAGHNGTLYLKLPIGWKKGPFLENVMRNFAGSGRALSASVTFGTFLTARQPDAKQLASYIGGGSIDASAAAFFAGGLSYSPSSNVLAAEYGVGIGGGIAPSYTFHVFGH